MKPFLNKFLNIFHFRRQTARLSARHALFAVLGAVFVIYGVFIVSNHASAEWTVEGIVKTALGAIFGLLFYLLGGILSVILEILVSVAQYNNIIGLEVVKNTWGTVRDIVNMFFIFAMLLIAFSTILRIHQYEAKQLLPKLILYAVLVNFSLTICGLFIDIAQVFTLTFVNAFGENAVSNFTNITGILQYDKIDFGDAGKAALNVLVGYILALILLLVSIVIIGAFVLIFLVRIVYLWILSILSPFAFVLPIIPGGQSYASQWWTMFSKQVITAPLLAFFIWLSLTVLGGMGSISNQILNKQQDTKISGEVNLEKTVMIGGSEIGTGEFLIGFIISIGMLFVGLMLTSQMSGAASKILGGATDVLKGKLGPTPMRWARERYGSWRGQRESIRKDSAQRFGQGVSAWQDRQMSARVFTPVSETLGRATSFVSGGRWKMGQKSAERATDRYEKHAGKKTSEEIQTYSSANRLDLINDPEKLHALRDKEPNKLRRAAINMRLNEMRHLGRGDNDADTVTGAEYQYEYNEDGTGKLGPDGKPIKIGVVAGKSGQVTKKGHISETSEFLDRAPELKQRFEDTMKKSNLGAAIDSSIYRDGKGEINTKEFTSDALQGKIDLSALTMSMVNQLDSVAGGQGKYFTELARAIRDTKEMVRIFGSINKDVKTQTMDDVKLQDIDISDEMRTAFGEATGHFRNVFTKKGVGEDGKEKDVFDENMAGKFFSRAENKDSFVRGHGTKFENKELTEFLHDKWLKYEFTGSQWAKMHEDTQSRDSIQKVAPDLLDKINKDSASYNTDYAKDNGYGYGKNRLRDTLIAFTKSDKYKDKDGKLRDIYEINDKDKDGNFTPLADASKKALDEQIQQGRISAQRLENMYENMVDENGDEIKVDGKPIFNERLLSAVALFESGALAALGKESAKRLNAVLRFMAKDGKNYGKYQPQVDRLANNNALVHMVTEELRTLIKESKAEWEKIDPEKEKKKK